MVRNTRVVTEKINTVHRPAASHIKAVKTRIASTSLRAARTTKVPIVTKKENEPTRTGINIKALVVRQKIKRSIPVADQNRLTRAKTEIMRGKRTRHPAAATKTGIRVARQARKSTKARTRSVIRNAKRTNTSQAPRPKRTNRHHLTTKTLSIPKWSPLSKSKT